MSPTPPRQFTPHGGLQPSTPTVVPPTPSPVPGPSSARTTISTQSSSTHDVFYDAQDTPERQTNRRSMYRSPGTSSSPDLATLLRKAKERGGVVGPYNKNDKRCDSPPPVPPAHDRLSTSGRPRSSTSYSPYPSTPQATPLPKGNVKPSRGNLDEASPDWVLASSRQTKENGSTKVRFLFPWPVVLFSSVHRGLNLRLERRQVLSWERCLGRVQQSECAHFPDL